MATPDEKEMKKFLEVDFYNELRWLFEAAVAWQAAGENGPGVCRPQIVLALDSCVLHARALYEFFYAGKKLHDDDARAGDFAVTWTEDRPNSPLYKKYMVADKPANKRLFHLVYGRSAHAGGAGHDGPDHLKYQVVPFAQDLRRLTEEFVKRVEPRFRDNAQSALFDALNKAKGAAKSYGIANPLRLAAGFRASDLR